MKQALERQQLRERLAKQTLQRQKQKEEKERILRGDQPLRHWGQDDPGTPPAGQFPHGMRQNSLLQEINNCNRKKIKPSRQ